MNDESIRDAYARKLTAVLPLIEEEWPAVKDEVELAKENFEKVVAVIASHADKTKVVVRRQIAELIAVADATNGESTAREKKPARDQIDEVLSAIRRLETFAAEEAKRVSDKVLPIAETKVRQNLWVSLLFTFGLGLIFGLWMNRGRRRGRHG